MKIPPSLASELARFVAQTPTIGVESIADELESGRVVFTTPSGALAMLEGVSRDSAMKAARLLTRLSATADEPSVAMALRCGVALRELDDRTRPQIEIAWTGPNAEGPLVRPTKAVLEEMIGQVREAGEVLLVGYSLTVGKDTAMAKVVHLLEQASKKRARVTLVLHHEESAKNRSALLAAWDATVKKPKILTWKPQSEHPYTKLHAKALIVDRLDLLVGSANFTFHGLGSNLELGLRVRGGAAREVAERFDFLQANGTLVDWSD